MNAISTANHQAPRRRGRKRRGTPEAPCADCIQRASQSSGKGDVRFCNDCARALGHARRSLPEQTPKLQSTSGNRVMKRADYHRRATANSITAALKTASSQQTVRASRDRLVALPVIFDSLKHAADTLQPVEGRLSSLILDIESHDQATVTPFSQDAYRRNCRTWLSDWEKAFAAYLSQSIVIMTGEELKAAWTLKAHHLIAETFAAVQLTEAQLDWSVFTAGFVAVLQLATEVVKDLPSHHVPSTQSSRANSLDKFQSALPEISILDPVYEVQLRTTNLDLQDQARRLLRIIDPSRFEPNAQEPVAGILKVSSIGCIYCNQRSSELTEIWRV
ncbi:hypothetical protein AMS68_006672 [Peltaster fructicola]|uniref:Uncharacterized protein n=1 Tax=Peltaster fructicola TaxID=286661 RepID=A0A6H0Y2K5_9PEZI|nr:hypothetical protein AMS68_006672 [Peltaster fructicola]